MYSIIIDVVLSEHLIFFFTGLYLWCFKKCKFWILMFGSKFYVKRKIYNVIKQHFHHSNILVTGRCRKKCMCVFFQRWQWVSILILWLLSLIESSFLQYKEDFKGFKNAYWILWGNSNCKVLYSLFLTVFSLNGLQYTRTLDYQIIVPPDY